MRWTETIVVEESHEAEFDRMTERPRLAGQAICASAVPRSDGPP